MLIELLSAPSANKLCHEAKTRAPAHANSVTDLASLLTPSANKLCHEVRSKALLGTNSEAFLTSLARKALYNRAKFASRGKTKAVVFPCEATPSGEATLASPMAKKKALKAKPKASQPEIANIKLLESLRWIGWVQLTLI